MLSSAQNIYAIEKVEYQNEIFLLEKYHKEKMYTTGPRDYYDALRYILNNFFGDSNRIKHDQKDNFLNLIIEFAKLEQTRKHKFAFLQDTLKRADVVEMLLLKFDKTNAIEFTLDKFVQIYNFLKKSKKLQKISRKNVSDLVMFNVARNPMQYINAASIAEFASTDSDLLIFLVLLKQILDLSEYIFAILGNYDSSNFDSEKYDFAYQILAMIKIHSSKDNIKITPQDTQILEKLDDVFSDYEQDLDSLNNLLELKRKEIATVGSAYPREKISLITKYRNQIQVYNSSKIDEIIDFLTQSKESLELEINIQSESLNTINQRKIKMLRKLAEINAKLSDKIDESHKINIEILKFSKQALSNTDEIKEFDEMITIFEGGSAAILEETNFPKRMQKIQEIIERLDFNSLDDSSGDTFEELTNKFLLNDEENKFLLNDEENKKTNLVYINDEQSEAQDKIRDLKKQLFLNGVSLANFNKKREKYLKHKVEVKAFDDTLADLQRLTFEKEKISEEILKYSQSLELEIPEFPKIPEITKISRVSKFLMYVLLKLKPDDIIYTNDILDFTNIEKELESKFKVFNDSKDVEINTTILEKLENVFREISFKFIGMRLFNENIKSSKFIEDAYNFVTSDVFDLDLYYNTGTYFKKYLLLNHVRKFDGMSLTDFYDNVLDLPISISEKSVSENTEDLQGSKLTKKQYKASVKFDALITEITQTDTTNEVLLDKLINFKKINTSDHINHQINLIAQKVLKETSMNSHNYCKIMKQIKILLM